jgi:hypothetical protein
MRPVSTAAQRIRPAKPGFSAKRELAELQALIEYDRTEKPGSYRLRC